MKDPTLYAPFLWFFLGLFFIRVIGQVIVFLFHPAWLPPMKQWYSGLIPYRILLPIQIIMLLFMAAIATDFSRGQGRFVVPHPNWAPGIVWLSYLYLGSMIVRYIVRMKRHPDQRWFGGTIPIIFHCVLALFLFSLGRYHLP